jgi:hypothetical protein
VAFADPQTVTISGTGNTLNRVAPGSLNSGAFAKDDGNVKLSISHNLGKRNRRTIRLDHRKVAADPLNAAQNLNYSMSVYIVADVPTVGYTPTEAKAVLDGFLANLQAASAANEVKFFGGES